jgi:hypothetical protein
MDPANPKRAYTWRASPNRLKEKPDWAFSLRWALATSLGGTLSWILAYSLAFFYIVSPHGSVERAKEIMLVGMNPLGIFLCLGGLLCLTFGLSVGLAQVLVLRKRPRWTGAMSQAWVINSTFSYVLAFAPPVALLGQGGSICLAFLAAGLAGLLLSWLQWLSLRQYVHGVDIWMFANVIGATLASALATFAGYIFYTTRIVPILGFFFDWGYALVSTIVIAIGLLVYGFITGIALNKMERDTVAHARAAQLTP